MNSCGYTRNKPSRKQRKQYILKLVKGGVLNGWVPTSLDELSKDVDQAISENIVSWQELGVNDCEEFRELILRSKSLYYSRVTKELCNSTIFPNDKARAFVFEVLRGIRNGDTSWEKLHVTEQHFYEAILNKQNIGTDQVKSILESIGKMENDLKRFAS